MTGQRWHGLWIGLGTFGVFVGVIVVGAALLLQTNRAITRLQRERDAYRADRQRRRDEVTLARALAAPWHDVYGGDDA